MPPAATLAPALRCEQPVAARARWMALTLLLALACALLPALFPAGSMMSRPHPGSAFDPTSSTVTLRARQDRPIEATRAAERADPPIVGAGATAFPARLPVERADRAATFALTEFAAGTVAPLPSMRAGTFRARAPPALD